MTAQVPSWFGVALSLLLVAIAVAVVVRLRLGLAREVLVAAARAAAQLVAVGAALGWLFGHAGLAGSTGWVAGMVLIGGRVAGRRGRGLPRPRRAASAGLAVGTAATLGLLVGAGVVSSAPRVVVPVGGMVVSAALTACGLTLARLRDEVETGRAQVEARLALGLSGEDAIGPQLRRALRSALLPGIDSTRVVGLISLPGAMTGLILAGVPPLTAIRYQVVVMYLGLGGPALTSMVTALLVRRDLFDAGLRLRELTPLPSRGGGGRRRLLRRGRDVAQPEQRGEHDPQGSGPAAQRTDDERRPDAQVGAEDSPEDRAERDRPPDHEPDARVHPAEQPGRAQGLAVGDLGDVVDDGAEGVRRGGAREQ